MKLSEKIMAIRLAFATDDHRLQMLEDVVRDIEGMRSQMKALRKELEGLDDQMLAVCPADSKLWPKWWWAQERLKMWSDKL